MRRLVSAWFVERTEKREVPVKLVGAPRRLRPDRHVHADQMCIKSLGESGCEHKPRF
jgi:hypothetical protein